MTLDLSSGSLTSEQPRDGEIVVQMEHVHKDFGNHSVLRDVTLHIRKGENVVLLGKSGTGKSVILKCIVGLVPIDDGKLLVLGENVAELKHRQMVELRRRIGFLFQSSALYDSMTVRENLEFPLRSQLRSRPKESTDQLVAEALDDVGLSETIDLMPSRLSGGMRKRLGLARTLILKPEIMLYDEPTTGLDPITSREISDLILEVQQKYKTSSVIVTHDIECAKRTANRIIVIKAGSCEAEGTFAELEKSADPWVRSFFE